VDCAKCEADQQGSAERKRERIPDVLGFSEFQALLQGLSFRERTLVALDWITGFGAAS